MKSYQKPTLVKREALSQITANCWYVSAGYEVCD